MILLLFLLMLLKLMSIEVFFFFILFVTRIAYTTPQVFTVRSAWRVFMETLQSEDQQTVKSVHAP